MVARTSPNHPIRPRYTLGGIFRPISLAALRLITNSNFVGCSIGKSAGFSSVEDLVNVNGRAAVHVGKPKLVR
jgi:hypothetical protein